MITACLFIIAVLVILFLQRVKKRGKDFDGYDSLLPVIKSFQSKLFFVYVLSLLPFIVIMYWGLGFNNVQHHHLEFTGIEFRDTLKIKNTESKTASVTENSSSDLFFVKAGEQLKMLYNAHDNPCTELLYSRPDAAGDAAIQWINKAYRVPVNNQVLITCDTLPALGFSIKQNNVSAVLVGGREIKLTVELNSTENSITGIVEKAARKNPDIITLDLLNKLILRLEGSKLVRTRGERTTLIDFFPGSYIQKSPGARVAIDGAAATINPALYAGSWPIAAGSIIESRAASGARERYAVQNEKTAAFYRFDKPTKFQLFDRDLQKGDTCSATITTNENTIYSNTWDSVYYAPVKLLKDNIYNTTYYFGYRNGIGNSNLQFRLSRNVPIDSLHYEAGSEIPYALECAKQPGVKWRMIISNSIQQKAIIWLFVVLTLLYLLIHFSHNFFYNIYTPGELKWYQKLPAFAYTRRRSYQSYNPVISTFLITLLPLLALRIFLMWRVSSFPPVVPEVDEGTFSYFSFEIRSQRLLLDSLILLGAIFTWALFLLKPKWLQDMLDKVKLERNTILSVLLAVLAVCMLIAPFATRTGWTRVLTTSGIILALFCLYEIKRSAAPFPKFLKNKLWFALLVLFFLACEFWMEKSFLVVTVFGILVWYFFTSGKPGQRKLGQLATWAGGIALVLVVAFSPYITRSDTIFRWFSGYEKSKQTIARTALMVSSRDAILFKDETLDNDTLFEKVVSTNQNQAFINWYKEYGGFYTVLPSLKQHYALNKDYNTQATDITALRYIAAEHGWALLIPLLLLLLMPLYARLIVNKYPLNENLEKNNRLVNADLLYLIIYSVLALFVMLSSTNMFVFMGLDLPLIGFHSLQAILLFVFIFFIIAASYNRQTDMFKVPPGNKAFQGSFAWWKKTFIWTVIIALLGMIVVMNMFFYQNKSAKSKYSLQEFNARMSAVTDSMNIALQEFQFRHMEANPKLKERELLNLVRDSISTLAGSGNGGTERFIKRMIINAMGSGNGWVGNNNKFISVEKKKAEDPLTLKETEFFYFHYRNPGTKRFPIDEDLEKKPVIYAKKGDQRVILMRTIWENGNERLIYPQRDSFPLIYHLSKTLLRDSLQKDSICLSIDLAINDSLTALLKANPKFTGEQADKYRQYHRFALLRPFDLKNRYNGTGLWWDGVNAVLKISQGMEDTVLSKAHRKTLNTMARQVSFSRVAGKLVEFLEDDIAERCKQVTVTAVDQDGNIKVLFTYNSDHAFDPNRFDDIMQELGEYSIVGTNESALENSLLTNPAMQKLFPGPGSSIKPIMYTAIASQADIPWQDIVVPNNYLAFTGGDNKEFQEKYAQENILEHRVKWRTNKGKDGVFSELSIPSINEVQYLSRSSNLYHSTMLFLGYYPAAQLKNYDQMLMPGADPTKHFPVINIGGESYYFDSTRWPVGNFGSSVLCQGLQNNYGFKFGAMPDTTNGFLHDDNIWSNYIFGTRPIFDTLVDYKKHKYSWFNNYIFTTTSGGQPISVSPLQMSLLSARMFSQNSSLFLSWNMADSAERKWSPFLTGNNSYYEVLNKVMEALSKDIFIDGTLAEVARQLKIDGGKGPGKIGQLFLLAKTGTTSAYGKDSDKMLMGCLSKSDMSAFKTADEFKGNKFISFFIRQKEGEKAEKGADVLRSEIIKQLAKIFQK